MVHPPRNFYEKIFLGEKRVICWGGCGEKAKFV